MDGRLLCVSINDLQNRVDADFVDRIEKSIGSIDLLFQDISKYSEMDINEQLVDWNFIKAIVKTQAEKFKSNKSNEMDQTLPNREEYTSTIPN